MPRCNFGISRQWYAIKCSPLAPKIWSVLWEEEEGTPLSVTSSQKFEDPPSWPNPWGSIWQPPYKLLSDIQTTWFPLICLRKPPASHNNMWDLALGAVASFSLCPHLPIESESYYSNICSSTIAILENGSKGANFSKAGIQWGQTHSTRCRALPFFLLSPSPVMFGDPRELS